MTNENQIMMDGYPLQVGDRVYSILWGWGNIREIDLNAQVFRIGFDAHIVSWTNNKFKDRADHEARTLFWNKPAEITPPPKPKRMKKIKAWDWFVLYYSGEVGKVNGVPADNWQITGINVKVAQTIDGTEREIEVEE